MIEKGEGGDETKAEEFELVEEGRNGCYFERV